MKLKEGDKITADYNFIGTYAQIITNTYTGVIIKDKNRLKLKKEDGTTIRIDKLDKQSIKLL